MADDKVRRGEAAVETPGRGYSVTRSLAPAHNVRLHSPDGNSQANRKDALEAAVEERLQGKDAPAGALEGAAHGDGKAG